MNTIERLIVGITPLPWNLKTNETREIVDGIGNPVAETYGKYGDDQDANAHYLVLIANAGPRLVEFVSRFAESFGQVESQLDSPELEMLRDARTLLKDLLGNDDDAKIAYMQRSMRETRKK